MKKSNFFSLPFFTLLIFINFYAFAQENVNQYEGGIIAGTNRRFIISFKQQQSIKAKIIAIENDKLVIKEGNMTNKIYRNAITNIEEIPFGTRGNAGVGFGIPYGILGFNLELNLLPLIAITGGFGTTIFSGIGYSAGLKGYLRKPGPVWRPRAAVYYGINSMYAEDFNHPDNEKYPGVTVGLGQLFMWQQHGFDLDLMYILTSDMPPELKEGGDIKISIGYKYAF